MTDDEDGHGTPAPLLQPPRLRTAEDRPASRLELFFDLAYVLVVAELVTSFEKDLGWHGAAVFAGLFTATWWSWVTTTLYANRFDTNDVPYRIAKLGQAFAVVVMAAAASHAVGEDAGWFAAGYIASRVLLIALYARAYRHVEEARRTLVIYTAGAIGGAGLWTVAYVVPDTWRYVLWAVGVALEATAPILATRSGGNIPLHEDHLPERFGLFTILVLGECVSSVMLGLQETQWRPSSVLVAAVGFTIAATLWWNYFDIGGVSGKQNLVDDENAHEADDSPEVDERHDRYVFGHLPVLIGVAAVAVGIEEFALHPTGELSPGARWALCGGAALFLLGLGLVMAGTSRAWSAAFPWPGVAVPLPLLAGLLPSPAAVVSAVGVVLLATVVAGMRQKHVGNLPPDEI